MRKLLAGLLALAFMAGLPAHATNAPPSPPATAVLSGQVALSVSSTSSRVALPSAAASAGAITVYNKGTTDTYVALGSSLIVATSGGTCIAGVQGPSCLVAAGTSITFWNVGSATHIAGITASSTSTLIIYQGTGPLGMRVSGSGGGGSGTVTEVDTGTGLTGGPITTSGTVALKPAAAGEIGGVNSSAAVTHNFLTAISTAGVISKAQPACADISDAGTGCSGAASATGANPSATIGASAVNGSAVTFMRSDAAPALPATLPALSGSNLTALNASALASGTVPAAQTAALTGDVTKPAGSNATTLANIPAISGANLTNLNASNLASGTVATARGGAGTTSGILKADGAGLVSAATAGTDYLTGSSTNTLTNKTYDTAGTGNSFSINGLAATANTGTGAIVRAASAALTTPDLGTPSAVALTNATSIPAGQLTGSIADARLSANVPLLNAANIFTAKQLVSGASFGLTGNISAAAWTTNGIRYANVPATLTDTTSSGTVGNASTDVFGGNTIAASSAVTFTKYSTMRVPAPTAGTNVTFTNAWSADLDSLTVGTSNPFMVSAAGVGLFGGTLTVTSTTTLNGNVNIVNNRLDMGGQGINTVGNISFSAASQLNWSGRGIITSPASGTTQFGPADVDTGPVAQTLRTQGALAGGTSNVAGANFTIIVSPGKGTGAGGSFIVQTAPAGSTGTVVGTPTTALTIDSTKLATFAGNINWNGFTSDTSNGIMSTNAAGPQFQQRAASSTTAVIIPNRADSTTGIGAQASGNMSMIVGGAEQARYTTNSLATLGRLTIGSLTPVTGQAGDYGFIKETDAAAAPGAGFCVLKTVAGTNSGSGKVLAYCGTSTTPVTIVDNVGGGF